MLRRGHLRKGVPAKLAVFVFAVGAAGCGKAPPLLVSEVWLDRAAEPRGEEPLIAGEEVLFGLKISGGKPPFEVKISIAPIHGTDRGFLGETAITPAPGSSDLEVGLKGPLEAGAPSGLYTFKIEVRDQADQLARAYLPPIAIVGTGAELVDQPAEVRALDAGGRARKTFFRGEPVTLVGPAGARAESRIPRGAASGPATLRAVKADGSSLDATIDVGSRPFLPQGRLALEELTLYGGKTLRAPLAARLERGRRIGVHARIASARIRVAWSIELRRGSEIVYRHAFPPTPVADARADARLYLEGETLVPASLSPGRYQLFLTAKEGQDVSTLQRDVELE